MYLWCVQISLGILCNVTDLVYRCELIMLMRSLYDVLPNIGRQSVSLAAAPHVDSNRCSALKVGAAPAAVLLSDEML